MAHVCFFVPEHILKHVARQRASERLAPGPAQRSALVSQQIRERRRRFGLAGVSQQPTLSLQQTITPPKPGDSDRQIFDDQNTWNVNVKDVRNEGDAPVGGPADAAYDALGIVRAFYRQVVGRESIDNQGMTIIGNVNFGLAYDNAFWDGAEMVFGNGDNVVFKDFTGDLDVPGHELTHGVTQFSCGLGYTPDQVGALNEALSDIAGSAIDAWHNNKDAGSHDWLIGEGIMADQLAGEAIRNMAYPGTAYDDPILGVDPQPLDMSGYTEPGDPHLNSGIINRWFYLVSQDLGINEAFLVVYYAMQNLTPTSNFVDFVEACSATARILAKESKVPAQAAQAVRAAARSQKIL